MVVLVDRGDSMATILALSPDMTKHLDYKALAAFNITPLTLATEVGNIDVVHQLIDGGASLDGTSYLGFSPLHLSIRHGYWTIAQSLLETGASPYYHEEHYRAKLLYEASMSFVNKPSEENEGVIVSLLNNGVDLEELSAFLNLRVLFSQWTLMAMKGHREILEQFIIAGSNLTETRNTTS